MDSLKKILNNPLIMFFLGFLVSTLLWKYPIILAFMAVVMVMAYIGLKTDFLKKKNGKGENPIIHFLGAKSDNLEKAEKQGKYCSECGSARKHKGTCSKSKKKQAEIKTK